jgi:hypothetical protein
VETPVPAKFVGHLIGRQAFINFSRGYGSAETSDGAQISGTGSRPAALSAQVKPITRDFQADDRVLADFRRFLEAQKISFAPEDFEANRAAVAAQITDEVLRQVFGEGEARKRSVASDPQIRRSLELMPKAELLLREPQRFIAEREADSRVASSTAVR